MCSETDFRSDATKIGALDRGVLMSHVKFLKVATSHVIVAKKNRPVPLSLMRNSPVAWHNFLPSVACQILEKTMSSVPRILMLQFNFRIAPCRPVDFRVFAH